MNTNRVADIFINNDYINALYEDVLDYSKDLCRKCAIPEECATSAITVKKIGDIQKAYTYGAFEMDEMYSESTYVDLIKSLNRSIVSSTRSTVKENGLEVESTQKTAGASTFANEITSYLQDRVEFKYVEDIQSVINICSTLFEIGIVLFAILSVAFLLLTISFTDKKYKAIRAVCFSVYGASLLDFVLVLGVGIVAIFKDFIIYPLYFCQSVSTYIGNCIWAFVIEGFLLFLIGTMISAICWKYKRNIE